MNCSVHCGSHKYIMFQHNVIHLNFQLIYKLCSYLAVDLLSHIIVTVYTNNSELYLPAIVRCCDWFVKISILCAACDSLFFSNSRLCSSTFSSSLDICFSVPLDVLAGLRLTITLLDLLSELSGNFSLIRAICRYSTCIDIVHQLVQYSLLTCTLLLLYVIG